jgi:hypothetical protein
MALNSPATAFRKGVHVMGLYGLLITKDDEAVFEEWCRDQLALYDAVVCLDGSKTDATARIARHFAERLVYLHERDFTIPHKSDHGLRALVHWEILRRYGVDQWIMCCHADEFCYHDPRKIARKAEEEGYDLVTWYSLHFFPHPSELPDWEGRRHLPVTERHRHYHWGHLGSDLPWREDRLYKSGPHVFWDDFSHGSVRPWGVSCPAPFHPILRHYKVITTDPAWYAPDGPSTLFRRHWAEQEHRTGLPFPVRRLEDFFVSRVRHYDRCDRFDGTFPHSWNMGEEYRPDTCEAGRPATNARLTAPVEGSHA